MVVATATATMGIPRSRNRLPCFSPTTPRRCSRREVKRSIVKSFSEIRRKYAIEFDARDERSALTCPIRYLEVPASCRGRGPRWNETPSVLPSASPHPHFPISPSQIRNKLLRGVVGSRRSFLSPRREGALLPSEGGRLRLSPYLPKTK